MTPLSNTVAPIPTKKPRKIVQTHVVGGKWFAATTRRDITPIPIEEGRRYLIPLTKGKFTRINADDLSKIGTRAWTSSLSKKSGQYYAYQKNYSEHGEQTLMHRLIMNAGLGEEVDHIDRDGLNNTRENLRLCSRSQNTS